MPVISLPIHDLLTLLGKEMSPAELADAIVSMGAEDKGAHEGVLDIEFFPNRPDLYSVEGVARALRTYLGLQPPRPRYSLTKSRVELSVDPSVAEVRPIITGGLVKGLGFTEASLTSLVELQERLTETLGRHRKKVAIGIHDFDRVKPPFIYEAVGPHEIQFVPLGKDQPMDLQQILEEHDKGREYGPILQGKERYPIILDAQGEVLSFPPIINGQLTALSEATKNVFIDVTGLEEHAVGYALNIVVTALAERGGRLQAIQVHYPDRTLWSPDLAPRVTALRLDPAADLLGIPLTIAEAEQLLGKMGHVATARGKTLTVRSPAYRADLMHPVDLVEDIGIAHGVANLPPQLPKAMTIGNVRSEDDIADQAREAMVGFGFLEITSLDLVPEDEPFASPTPKVRILNPVSADTACLRSALLPSLMTILRLNRHRDLPQRIFEVSEVAQPEGNRMHLAVAMVGPRIGFTDAKGLMQGLLRDAGLIAQVEPREDPNFILGRAADIVAGGRRVGYLGEVHPEVVTKYDLEYPVAAMELDLEALPIKGSAGA
jgi:phenylalanyl-tRNA synthetase beta chain